MILSHVNAGDQTLTMNYRQHVVAADMAPCLNTVRELLEALEHAGDGVHRALGASVNRGVQRQQPGDSGADVDDAAAFPEVFGGGLGDEQQPEHADVEHPVKILPGDGVEGTKHYDHETLDAANAAAGHPHAFTYFAAGLDPATAALAAGAHAPAVCAFVNDRLDPAVLEALAGAGVRLVALRCAGFDRVDLACAEFHKLSVVRVPPTRRTPSPSTRSP